MSVKERRGRGESSHDRLHQGDSKSTASSSKRTRENGDKKEDAESSSSEEDDDILARTSLDLSSHPMPPLEALAKTMAQFSQLQKLDVSSMKPSSDNPKGLSSLQWLGRATRKGKERAAGEGTFGDNLSWLKMTDNPALGEHSDSDAWLGIENLTSLAVLNASSCALASAPPASALLKLTSLAALVLAHNSIAAFTSIPHLPNLNTLVLSHNKIVKLPKDLAANLPSLKKLSITQNALQWKGDESPLPDFTQCSHLREIRLSGNSRLCKLPLHLSTWGRGEGRDRKGTGLETLELADCGLNDWMCIDPLMKMSVSEDTPRKRRGMVNLSLKGNAVTGHSQYRSKILEAHPTLRTLDGERVEKKSAENVNQEGMDEASEATRFHKERKRGERGEKEPIKSAQDMKKVAKVKDGEAPLQESKLSSKARVRGKRGGRIANVSKNGNDTVDIHPSVKPSKSRALSNDPESGGKEVKGVGKADTDTDERIARRAGPPPLAELVSKKKDKSTKAPKSESKEGQMKKRKAWDESTEEKKVYGKKRALQSSPPLQKEREKERAQTSVAAVIQLNKKQKEAGRIEKPIWGQIGGAEASVGLGSAWD